MMKNTAIAPRPITADEAREKFLELVRAYVEYWANESRTPDTRQKLDGLAFSILNILDGTTVGFPACDVVLRPHADDEEFLRGEGNNWYVNGQVINAVLLHEMFYKNDRR
jgi:hypothetical protein